MESKIVMVSGLIEFWDVVMMVDWNGLKVYVW